MRAEERRRQADAKVQVLPQSQERKHRAIWNVELRYLVAHAFDQRPHELEQRERAPIGDEVRFATNGTAGNQAFGDANLGIDEVVDVDVIVKRTGIADRRDETALGHLLEHFVQHEVVAGTINPIGP